MLVLKENKKVILVITAVILIVFAVVKINNLNGNENQIIEQKINTEIPFGDNNNFDNKLDAYTKEEEDSLNKRRESFSDFGSVNIEGIGSENLSPEEKIDSLLKANQIDYSDNNDNKGKKNVNYSNSGGNSSNNNRTYANTNGNSSGSGDHVRNEENKIDKDNLNNFFKSNPQEKEKPGGVYDKMIYATIYGDKNTGNGERVALRLSQDATINGKKYERNTILYSFAKFGQNRVFLHVDKINLNDVNLDVYDTQDGGLGIYTEANVLNKSREEIESDLKIKGIPVEKITQKLIDETRKNQKVMLFNNYKLILKKGQ